MDLTDEQWTVLQPLIPEPPKRPDGRGRPRRDNREILNGILWIMRTGAQWKDMPERYPPEAGYANLAQLAALKALAGAKGCSTAQIALAWLIAQGDDIVPIPGTTRVKNLELNAAATEIEFSADELARIDEVVPRGATSGLRCSEAAMRAIDS